LRQSRQVALKLMRSGAGIPTAEGVGAGGIVGNAAADTSRCGAGIPAAAAASSGADSPATVSAGGGVAVAAADEARGSAGVPE